jgi:hypothetical protein
MLLYRSFNADGMNAPYAALLFFRSTLANERAAEKAATVPSGIAFKSMAAKNMSL